MSSLEELMHRAVNSDGELKTPKMSEAMKTVGQLLSPSPGMSMDSKQRDYHGLSREYHENEMALLATWYVENRVQWHSKYTTMAGKGDGVQVMDKLAQQWANDLARLGFASRSIASVKQKIRDLRKRARLVNSKEHRLRSTARGRPMKVPEWLQAVADAMVADEEAANGIINQLDGTDCNSNSSVVNDDDNDSICDQKYENPQELLNTLFAAPGTAGPPAPKRSRMSESASNSLGDLSALNGSVSPTASPPLLNGLSHEVGKIDESIDAVVNGAGKHFERTNNWMSNEFAGENFESLGMRERNYSEMAQRTEKMKQKTEMLRQVTERMKQRTEKLRQLALEEQLRKLGVPEEAFMSLE